MVTAPIDTFQIIQHTVPQNEKTPCNPPTRLNKSIVLTSLMPEYTMTIHCHTRVCSDMPTIGTPPSRSRFLCIISTSNLLGKYLIHQQELYPGKQQCKVFKTWAATRLQRCFRSSLQLASCELDIKGVSVQFALLSMRHTRYI